MANATYFDFMDAVASYYGSGSDAWLRIAQMGVTPETLPLIQQIPGVSVTLSNSGSVLGYDLSNAFASPVDPVSTVDSNLQTGLFGNGAFNANVPATVVTDLQTQENSLVSGLKTTTGGLTVAAVADKIGLGVMGVSLGTKLGKAIDSTLYNLNPNFWDENYPTINPETWDDMATTQGGKTLIRSIFGLQNDNTTMYIDERMLAYTYMMLLASGAYNTGDITINPNKIPDKSILLYPNTDYSVVKLTTGGVIAVNSNNPSTYYESPSYVMSSTYYTSSHTLVYPLSISQSPFSITGTWPSQSQAATNHNITYYFKAGGVAFDVNRYIINTPSFDIPAQQSPWDIAYLYYHDAYDGGSGIDGVDNNSNASTHINPTIVINPTTQLPVTPNDNINDVLQALKTAYPDLFDGSVYEDIMQPDGSIDRITYIPTPFPDQDTNGNPITDMTPDIDPQTNPEINPETRPSPYLQNFTDTVTTNPTTPETGDGETSPIITPTGEASSLWAIYNPTQTELNNFGAWLWSSTFVEQIKKLFNDPMQAIIGIHKVFATPSTGASANIKCGYIDSGVSAKTVTSQYTTVSCGSVNLYEYFGNVFDYDPFTKVEIFLPFIGIVPLNLDYIMRSKITVKYTVDVLSGACIANIKVTRDGYGSVLFTYGGSAIVTYPISSGSYMGMVSGALSLIAGVAGTVASGGVLAPAMLGAASGIGRMKTEVQHSGQFSGACGAMGAKKPYLIISRPQTRMADNINQYDGIPSNTNVQLSECTGYTKVKTVHLSIPGAYDSEIQEIEQLLKDGIII